MRSFIAIALAGLLAVAGPSSAQMTLTGAGSSKAVAVVASYTGPGDAVSGAQAWFGLRAYSAATAGSRAINLCDNAGANCADIATSTTTGKLNNPGTLGSNNCATSNTCQIAIVYDQVGTQCTGGTAPCDVSQSTTANRPTLTFNCFNGLPCMVFNGSQSLVAANSIISGTANGTFTGVAERTSTFTNFNGLIELGSGGLGWENIANNGMLYDGIVNPFTMSDSVVHSVTGVFNGASSVAYVDNVSTSLSSPGSTLLQTFYGLGIINGGLNLTGNIMEAGYWTSTFTSGNATSMCHNQFSFWGTATSC